jgi:hypothetical protein
MSKFTPSEMAVLRRSAAHLTGTCYRGWSIGRKLRHCLAVMGIARNGDGSVAGFCREGFSLSPTGWALFTWHEERERKIFFERG